MSGGSSDSESNSECEFQRISESDRETIRGCYNNETEYSQEEIHKMKEKNGRVSEKEGSKEEDTRLGNTTWCTCENFKSYENMNQSPADAVKKIYLYQVASWRISNV